MIEDQRLLGVIKQSWLESGCVYGYRKVHHDLRDLGELCRIRSIFTSNCWMVNARTNGNRSYYKCTNNGYLEKKA
jgi:hypothetical protein